MITEAQLDTYCADDSLLGVHPEHALPGVDFSTGSLGQGLPMGVGAALAARLQESSRRVFVLLSDAECNEGSTWEAIQVASNFHLFNLVVLLDRNRTSASGPMANRNDIEPLAEKWRAFNWAVKEVKGHDFQSINEGLQWSETITDRPAVIICHTETGRGMSVVKEHPEHNFMFKPEQYQRALIELENIEKELVIHAN